MSTITKPNTLVTGATITAAEHNDNYDTIYNDYNGNITNVNLSATAGIVDTKLAQITTASKVHGSSLTGLASINTSTAGRVPTASINTDTLIAIDALKLCSIDTSNTAVASKIPVTNASGLLTSFVTKAALGIDSGVASVGDAGTTVNFNFTFTANPVVLLTPAWAGDDHYVPSYDTLTTASMKVYSNSGSTSTAGWLVIGTPA